MIGVLLFFRASQKCILMSSIIKASGLMMGLFSVICYSQCQRGLENPLLQTYVNHLEFGLNVTCVTDGGWTQCLKCIFFPSDLTSYTNEPW